MYRISSHVKFLKYFYEKSCYDLLLDYFQDLNFRLHIQTKVVQLIMIRLLTFIHISHPKLCWEHNFRKYTVSYFWLKSITFKMRNMRFLLASSIIFVSDIYELKLRFIFETWSKMHFSWNAYLTWNSNLKRYLVVTRFT